MNHTVPYTTDIPMTFRIRGGKTVFVLPNGERAVQSKAATIDSTMVKILARAFRWQRLLANGTYNTIDDLAAAEKINPSYVSRVARLAMLSPEIIELILDGKQPAHLTMNKLLEPFPLDWDGQAKQYSLSARKAR